MMEGRRRRGAARAPRAGGLGEACGLWALPASVLVQVVELAAGRRSDWMHMDLPPLAYGVLPPGVPPQEQQQQHE